MARSKMYVYKPKMSLSFACGREVHAVRMRADPIVPRIKSYKPRIARSKMRVHKHKMSPSFACGPAVHAVRMRADPIVPRIKTYKPRHVTFAVREISRCQKSQKFLIAKSRFRRLVRELSGQFGYYRFKEEALMELQEASEVYLVKLFSVTNLHVLRAKRVTLRASDMQFTRG